MRLSAKDAIIPDEKLRNYVLSLAHPDGRAKAQFLTRLGYSEGDSQRLASDLREQHLNHEAVTGKPSLYGQKYEILAPLTGPNGASAWVRTVWIVRTGERSARLVTLIPEEKR
jgi:hypothetical protein